MTGKSPRDPRLPERVEAVLLDAGGVLLDLDYGYLRRLIEARHEPVEDAALARAEAIARREVDRNVADGGRVSDNWRDYFRTILGQVKVPAQEHDGIIDSLWDAHQRVGLWTVASRGATAAVAELKRRGFRLGVVSNAEGRVARDLDNAGYDGKFETVVDSFRVGVEKPDPGIFAIALERMALRPDSVVFLGDLPNVDVKGARAAGLTPILVDPHGLYPDVDALQLRSLEELPALLDPDPPKD